MNELSVLSNLSFLEVVMRTSEEIVTAEWKFNIGHNNNLGCIIKSKNGWQIYAIGIKDGSTDVWLMNPTDYQTRREAELISATFKADTQCSGIYRLKANVIRQKEICDLIQMLDEL